jgi:hypothetical protein
MSVCVTPHVSRMLKHERREKVVSLEGLVAGVRNVRAKKGSYMQIEGEGTSCRQMKLLQGFVICTSAFTIQHLLCRERKCTPTETCTHVHTYTGHQQCPNYNILYIKSITAPS